MRYLVPQFVERDIKVVGPLNFKQFLFFLAGAFGSLVAYIFLYQDNFMLFVLASLVSMGVGISLAFFKYHSVPLPELIVNFIGYSVGGKKYLWQKKAIVAQPYQAPQMKEAEEEVKQTPVQRSSRLENLSTRIDIEE